MATISISRGGDLPNSASKTDFHNLIDNATGTVTNIVSADFSASAGIVDTQLATISTAGKVNGSALTGTLVFTQGADIASEAACALGSATGNCVTITGTTTITSFTSAAEGALRFVRFSGALTLTYNATTLILPTSANITTAAGDCAIFKSEGSGNWRCLFYQRADGTNLVSQTNSNTIIQTRITQSSAAAQTTATAVIDDTTPTTTETPVITALNTAITASDALNTLLITVMLNVSLDSSASYIVISVFKDSGTDAIASTSWLNSASLTDCINPVCLQFYVSAGDTSAHTYKVGIGHTGGSTVTLNGIDGTRRFGGTLYSSVRIDEIQA